MQQTPHVFTLHTAKQQTPKKYLELKQPPLRPPPWVFGPVWTTLYALMGYSAYRAWTVGTTSLNPSVVALAKVWIKTMPVFCSSQFWCLREKYVANN